MTAGSTASLGFAAILVAAMLAGPALADDAADRALLLRQQQSDTFSLGVQQSQQQNRAAGLPPAERQQLDWLQRDQRLRQGDGHYRQQIQQSQPAAVPSREPEQIQMEQARQADRARDRAEVEALERAPQPAKPAPIAEPKVIWGPSL